MSKDEAKLGAAISAIEKAFRSFAIVMALHYVITGGQPLTFSLFFSLIVVSKFVWDVYSYMDRNKPPSGMTPIYGPKEQKMPDYLHNHEWFSGEKRGPN